MAKQETEMYTLVRVRDGKEYRTTDLSEVSNLRARGYKLKTDGRKKQETAGDVDTTVAGAAPKGKTAS